MDKTFEPGWPAWEKLWGVSPVEHHHTDNTIIEYEVAGVVMVQGVVNSETFQNYNILKDYITKTTDFCKEISLPVPFPRAYWVIPGLFLAGEYPGAKNPHKARQKLNSLFESGIRHIINLDGFVKSPTFALCCILRFFMVR